MAVRLTRKASLMKSVTFPLLHAQRAAENRQVDSLDKVYSRLMLGRKAEIKGRGDKKRKVG